ncbi:CMP/dCMP deaminase zinc-binding [Catenulispora acidiphila DSM 44928]|uniref:CMP/dCMP deaminase zinc-binding n=1 Tax=Catenulispora acidiphila (strain DSM 44928 / JCM 14897 / NBRC 102108 / NRRL B-24433 / ID139908) TaxID=479433 RepID=C7Q965_CATAD|nr:nucleoside deaminase [Catenulispora acidiphila]ACU72385.1 CMP/dCMP deaminase zinc-binding [Catenulispora acidiphila DSM 44928]
MTASPEDPLEEMRERTAETLADARKEVDRARKTLHDQIIPSSQTIDDVDYEDHSDPQADQAEPRTDHQSGQASDDWLGQAIALAQDNVEAGGWPFGAVIVRDGAVIATGVNEVLADGDPTAHAEMLAIREACRVLKDINLAGAVLYASCEPCPMCLAAIKWAGLTGIVYAADRESSARAGFPDKEIYDLFDQPRDAWPMDIRQQAHDHAEEPLTDWGRKHQDD